MAPAVAGGFGGEEVGTASRVALMPPGIAANLVGHSGVRCSFNLSACEFRLWVVL